MSKIRLKYDGWLALPDADELKIVAQGARDLDLQGRWLLAQRQPELAEWLGIGLQQRTADLG